MKILESSNSIYIPKFKAISLKDNATNIACELIRTLPSEQGKNGLYQVFEPHILNEAKEKCMHGTYIFDDVVNSMWVLFYTTLATITTMDNPLDILCKAIDNFKPGQNELNPEHKWGEVSLNNKFFGENGKVTLGDTISTEDDLNPLSYRSEEERQAFQEELESALKNSDLTDKEKELLRLRAKGKTYDEIAPRYGVSSEMIRLNTLTAIAKLQNGHNILPQEYTNKAKELIEVLELKKDIKTMEQWLIEHPELLPKDVAQLKENIQRLSESFDIDYETMVECGIKHPQLFYQSPETIEKNVSDLVAMFENEGLKTEDYIKACVKQPQLFCLAPKTIEKNVQELVKKFKDDGLTITDYIRACLKHPQLFYQSPETISAHIKAYMYIDKNNSGYKDENVMAKILHKCLSDSTSLIYLKGIILPQLKEHDEEISKWGWSGFKPNLEKYFAEYPDKQFTIRLVEDEMTDNCIQTIQEFCNKTFKRDDMFKFVITEKAKTEDEFFKELDEKMDKAQLTKTEKECYRLHIKGNTCEEIAKMYKGVKSIWYTVSKAKAKIKSLED